MAKTILKELLIIILVTVAISLILAVIFYQYVPNNKVIPSKVTAYQAPEEVKAEIEQNVEEEELISGNKVYEITDSDLAMYKRVQSYNPGKSDPFAAVTDSTTENENEVVVGNETKVPTQTNRNTTDNYYTAAGVGSGTK